MYFKHSAKPCFFLFDIINPESFLSNFRGSDHFWLKKIYFAFLNFNILCLKKIFDLFGLSKYYL